VKGLICCESAGSQGISCYAVKGLDTLGKKAREFQVK